MLSSKFVDLQIHSLYSDGDYTPTQLAALLKHYNIAVAALTDHNTVKGVPEFVKACQKLKIKPIAGIELYVKFNNKHLHLLGYNLDIHNKFLQAELAKIHWRKYQLLKSIVSPLKKKGLVIDPEKLSQEPADYIGMNNLLHHIEANPENVRQIQKTLGNQFYEHWQVIVKYFVKGRNTYYPEVFIPVKLGLKMIQRAGGTAILAHPGQQLRFEEDYLIRRLVKLGVAGIECFSSHHKYSQIAHYLRLAQQEKIIATGGSDFHGDLEDKLAIKRHWDYTLLPFKLYQDIKKF